MGAITPQITSPSIVYSTVYSDADQRKKSKFRVTGLCEENSSVAGEFSAQRANKAEGYSIRLRHHVCFSNKFRITRVSASYVGPEIFRN